MADRPGLVSEPAQAQASLTSGIDRENHHQALAGGQDVPEQQPDFPFPLAEAGITNKTVWVTLPQGRIPLRAEIVVDLPAHLRGIHMSRLEEAISHCYAQSFDNIRDYGLALAEHVLAHQRGKQIRISLQGALPHLNRTVVSERLSVDSVQVSTVITGTATTLLSRIGLALHHITACPCTQLYNSQLDLFQGQDLLPTHSQRSVTSLELADNGCRLTYDDLYACLHRALHLIQDLLKRPDEAEIVLLAHQQPQFAEDTVRAVARAVALELGQRLPPDTSVYIDSLSYESIHIHNVCCRIRTTLGTIVDHGPGGEKTLAR